MTAVRRPRGTPRKTVGGARRPNFETSPTARPPPASRTTPCCGSLLDRETTASRARPLHRQRCPRVLSPLRCQLAPGTSEVPRQGTGRAPAECRCSARGSPWLAAGGTDVREETLCFSEEITTVTCGVGNANNLTDHAGGKTLSARSLENIYRLQVADSIHLTFPCWFTSALGSTVFNGVYIDIGIDLISPAGYRLARAALGRRE